LVAYVVSQALAYASESGAVERHHRFAYGFAGTFSYCGDVVAYQARHASCVNKYALSVGESFAGFNDGVVEFLFAPKHDVGFTQVRGERVCQMEVCSCGYVWTRCPWIVAAPNGSVLKLDDIFHWSSNDPSATRVGTAAFSQVTRSGGYVARGDGEFIFFIF
jgi:hypothetical protein